MHATVNIFYKEDRLFHIEFESRAKRYVSSGKESKVQ